MPNHVKHKLNISGNKDELNRFRETCFVEKDGNLELDFNGLIPMPKILKETIAGNTSEMQTEKYQAIEAQAIKQSGHKDWYDWSNDIWGTKWNAYNTYRIDHNEETMFLEFDTAWSCPEPIIDKIAELFSTFECDGIALDEGYCFGAKILIRKGNAFIDFCVDFSPEFIEEFESQ